MFDLQTRIFTGIILLLLVIVALIFFGVPILMLAAAGGATKIMLDSPAAKYIWVPWLLAIAGVIGWFGFFAA